MIYNIKILKRIYAFRSRSTIIYPTESFVKYYESLGNFYNVAGYITRLYIRILFVNLILVRLFLVILPRLHLSPL